MTFEQAAARVSQMTNDLIQREAQGKNDSQWGMFLKPFVDEIAGPLKLALTVLMSAAGLVLLIACANVAGLQLARASGKMKEITLRQALGASRWQLVRQLLVESLLLSIIGGLLGLAFGYFGVRFISTAVPTEYSIIEPISIDWRVMLFTGLVAIGSGVIFGIAPALRSSSAQNYENLKEGGRSGTAGGAETTLPVGTCDGRTRAGADAARRDRVVPAQPRTRPRRQPRHQSERRPDRHHRAASVEV